VIGFAFAGFAAWGALAPLSGAVIGSGVVKVDSSRKTIQHLEGGIVHEIRVKDGDLVKQGQTLILLQDASVSASVDILGMQLYAEMAKAARVRAERDGLDAIAFPHELTGRNANSKIAEVLQSERHLFDVRRKAMDDQIRSLRDQVD
jgi:multidrug efflux pump subunit AcrA (membrane-fusion protein)